MRNCQFLQSEPRKRSRRTRKRGMNESMRACEPAPRALYAQNRQVSRYPCVPLRVCSGKESMASDKTDTSLFPLARSNILAFRRAPDPELDSFRMVRLTELRDKQPIGAMRC